MERYQAVYVEENMADEKEQVVFEAGIPYRVSKKGNIQSENGLKVPLHRIWVDFRLEHKWEARP